MLILNDVSVFSEHYKHYNIDQTRISDEKDLCAKYVSKLLVVDRNSLWGLDWHLKPHGHKYAYERSLLKAAKEFIKKK